ncbi:MAG TPA: ATP-binding cassette domain-containing protein [Dehalococcoidia bacterium]|nr:ATP-binding cassette domain-containing protein [Dehalococcoidia bacterium]
MIRVENLTKYYGEHLAVDSISFNVKKGEIVGLLGPNGAGKTTTMRILTGFMMPTSGDAWVAECNMATNSLEGRRHIGYLPEAIPLYTDVTVRSYLDFAGRLRGLDPYRIKDRIDDVVEICHLEDYIDVLIGKLSRGFRQRVGVAQAIIHEPEVMILDEPTLGIDPIQVTQTRRLIKELGQEHTILISSHILPEVSMVCDRVVIIHEGQIVAEDRIENLSTILKGSQSIRLEVRGPTSAVTRRLQRVQGISQVRYEKPYHIVECPVDQDPRSNLMTAIVQSGWTLLSMGTVDMSLEDIFLQLTGEEDFDDDEELEE